MTAKETDTIERYCNAGSDTYNNWCASYALAGYSLCKGWQTNAIHVLHKDHVKLAISEYKAIMGKKIDHDRDTAIALLHEALDIARLKKDNAGIVMACRELDAISGLHRTEAAAQAMQINIHLPDKDEG